jgi:hypothetical protein
VACIQPAGICVGTDCSKEEEPESLRLRNVERANNYLFVGPWTDQQKQPIQGESVAMRYRILTRAQRMTRSGRSLFRGSRSVPHRRQRSGTPTSAIDMAICCAN